ncbi:MAG: cytochrome c, class [Myxococcales bacterium]|nr:cytochrome c, class [Myxococcales bacterium]
MTRARAIVVVGALAFVVVVVIVGGGGCTLPGQPKGVSLEGQPSKVEDFAALYASSCAGCHGENGRGGAALGLDNVVYLAIADDQTLRRIIATGVAGTSMPAFAQSAGGGLTDRQVDVIARGIRTHWARAETLSETPPPYVGPDGEARRGAGVFATFCASCHGSDGSDGPKSRSIVDGSYLALVSAQSLRTLVIVGRPEIGQPDWRSDVPGRPLASQQIADVVAWLISHRQEFPGRPHARSR